MVVVTIQMWDKYNKQKTNTGENEMFYTINDRMVNDFFNDLDTIFTSSGRKSRPSNDFKTNSDEDGVTLTLNVPGYNKDLIEVSVDDDDLVIKGKSNSGDTGGFDKRFTIGDKLDVENVDATVVDGVLTISVPYLAELKPRKVEVKVK